MRKTPSGVQEKSVLGIFDQDRHKSYDLETSHAASGTQALQSLYKW